MKLIHHTSKDKSLNMDMAIELEQKGPNVVALFPGTVYYVIYDMTTSEIMAAPLWRKWDRVN